MTTMKDVLGKVHQAGKVLREQFGNSIDRAVICGSGLGLLADTDSNTSLNYANMPGMAVPSVTGHSGNIVAVKQAQGRVLFCNGRLHLYEGHSPTQVAFLVFALASAGVKKLVVTNAAGALNPEYSPGDVMLIEDHMNFTGQNPLVGWRDETEARFVDMSEPYSLTARERVISAAREINVNLRRGVYAGVLGPSLETSAERRMLRQLGGDAVGMSTVIEVIAARFCEMEVIGLSAITNLATGQADQKADNLDEIFMNAATAGRKIKRLLDALL